jgi:hypothetical protein
MSRTLLLRQRDSVVVLDRQNCFVFFPSWFFAFKYAQCLFNKQSNVIN